MEPVNSFELIPAIDLKKGQCVRLKQGRMQDATVYGDNPAEMALHWQNLGATRLHLVDLDGAFAGKPENRQAVADICKAMSIPVQLGGGLRDLTTIASTLELGIERVILGSIAVSQPDLVKQACAEFPNQICVGIDAKGGQVAVHGWDDVTEQQAVDLAKKFEDDGVCAIIYTDIARDGMLNGPNIEETHRLAQSVSIPVIASGGIARQEDVIALSKLYDDGICGAITGRAIYEHTLNFTETMQVLKHAL